MVLMLPDRDAALDGINHGTARIKRRVTMGRGRDHEHRGISHCQIANPVLKRDANTEPCLRLLHDVPTLSFGHVTIGRVAEADDGATVMVVTHDTDEAHDRTVTRRRERNEQRLM